VDWYYRRLSRKQPGKEAVGYRVAASDRIVSAWQNPHMGDIIADGPPGTAYYVVRQAEPDKSCVLSTDTHLRYLVPARLRDNPRLGIFGEVTWPVPGLLGGGVPDSRVATGPALNLPGNAPLGPSCRAPATRSACLPGPSASLRKPDPGLAHALHTPMSGSSLRFW
jgi:hypothetical protein